MPPDDVVMADAGPIAPRGVAAGRGAAWWIEGWRGFVAQWGTWAGILVAYAAISLLCNAAHKFGAVAEWLLSPVLMGGIMLGCDAQRRGERLRVAHLFDGFRGAHFVPLLLISVWNFVLCAIAVIGAVVVVAVGVGMSGIDAITSYAADPWHSWESWASRTSRSSCWDWWRSR